MRPWLAALLLLAPAALGVPVEKWVQTTRSDFQNGKAEGTAVLELGQVALAPELEPLLKEAPPHLWDLATDGKGTVYAAAGLPPKVLRIREGKAEELFAAPADRDLEVLAIAVGPKGTVYASTAPSGTLYRIDGDGQAAVHARCPDPYLWALAAAPDGAIFAATGPNGKLLRIAPDGETTEVLKAKDPHLLSLLRAPDGTLYAGTDRSGLVYRVSPQGESQVLYDAEETDIQALGRDPQRNIYFATAGTNGSNGSKGKPAPPKGRPPQSKGGGAPKPAAPGATLKATNAVYRIAPNGTVTKLAEIKGAAVYSLAWHDGHLLAGTGNDGKLYRITDGTAVLLADLEESQITALGTDPQGSLLLATANGGQVFRMAAPHAPKGVFYSEVYDTDSLSQWGQIAWQADVPKGARLTLATRTGNTARPDETWSDWSEEYADPAGQIAASPPARFVQYRATLQRGKDGSGPRLDEVVIAYVPANRPPEIAQIAIGKPPKPRRPGSSPNPRNNKNGKRKGRALTTQKKPAESQRGPFAEKIRVAWKATDPNKDDLYFAVEFRGEDETTWKRIADRLTNNHHDWDTERVPDGLYRFRIIASDVRDNPPDQARQGHRITEAFVIDNTRPILGKLDTRIGGNRAVTVRVQAKDAGSRLDSAEYAVDGGEWVQVAAQDGIFDSAAETLEFTTAPLAQGEHTVVVRAKDAAENSGAAKAVIVVE
jgi:hypothetical protein